MSELDDLDEILLTPTPGGSSAKRMRNGRKQLIPRRSGLLKQRFYAGKRRKRPVTLAGPPIKKSL